MLLSSEEILLDIQWVKILIVKFSIYDKNIIECKSLMPIKLNHQSLFSIKTF